MNRTTLARRYAPLAAALAVQLVIIVTAPSTAQKGTALATGQGGGFATGGEAGVDSGAGAGGAAGVDSGAGAGGAAGSGVASAAGAAGRAGALPPGVASGDTSHCVGGRQYDPAIAYWAPPCVPGVPGSPFPNNGGATGQGVTADS
ncbi:MAG: hypothetical protein JWP02_2868, partial [Acidimicrobiales bacterium]|nr:hypothetical protein [Acidimicrobiales bacterium]